MKEPREALHDIIKEKGLALYEVLILHIQMAKAKIHFNEWL